MDKISADNTHPRTVLIILYFSFFIVSALFFQLRSEISPGTDGSPIEYFTGGLLWISSMICLLMAEVLRTGSRRSWLWLVVCAGMALLALDELFVLHEKTERLVGDDDHIKVLQWFFAGGVLYLIDRYEISSLKTKIAFLTGYVFHGLYILTDVGDGNYYTIPFASVSQLEWTEEIFELLALTAYCIGFIYLYSNTLRAARDHDADKVLPC